MDLLLTDIRPAALEPPLSGKPSETGVPEFAALLRELPANAAETPFVEAAEVPRQSLADGNKMLKINSLMDDLDFPEQSIAAPPAALSAIAAALREPATSALAAPVAAAASPQPAQATPAPGLEASQSPAVTGDILPAGGSGLPPMAGPRQASTTATAAPAQAGSGPFADRTATTAAAAGLLPNADAVARGQAVPGFENGQSAPAAPNGPAAALRAGLVAASVAAPQPGAKPSITSSAAAAAAETAPGVGENPAAARVSRPEAAQPVAPGAASHLAPAAELASMRPAREQPVAVSLTRPMATNGTERSARPQWLQAVDAMPVAPPRDAAGTTGSAAEAVPVRASVTGPTVPVPGESVDPLGKVIVSAPLEADAEPQSPTRDASSFARGTELPQTGPAAQSPGAVTAPAAAAQAVSGPLAAAQTAVLPPQLEALSIARDAPVTEWGDGLGERVSWLINQKQNAATIRLDPPALGRLEVQIRVADDATTITIQTQHGQTRDLIEAGAPRLREFLQEAGFQNVNVDVSQRQEQQAGSRPQPDFEMAGDGEADGPGADADWIRGEGRATYRSDNLVDTFA